MATPKKIAIVRTDNLGDLLLSLPAIQQLREELPEAECTLIAKSHLIEVVQAFLDQIGVKSLKLEEKWEEVAWDAMLALHCSAREAFSFWKKRVPLRVGQYSRWWSLLFFNRRVRQRRSSADLSEAEYSLQLAGVLLREYGRPNRNWTKTIQLPIEPRNQQEAEQVLIRLGLKPSVPFFVIHPGMAGSALNLSWEQYQKIARELLKKAPVLLSIGPAPQDQLLGDRLVAAVPQLKKLEGLRLGTLQEVFRKSQGVIAPSTGPLHLAHLVGVPVCGIYSPVKSHHPKRWRPFGGQKAVRVLLPEVNCPGLRSCRGASCAHFNCMEHLDWGALLLKELDGLTKGP